MAADFALQDDADVSFNHNGKEAMPSEEEELGPLVEEVEEIEEELPSSSNFVDELGRMHDNVVTGADQLEEFQHEPMSPPAVVSFDSFEPVLPSLETLSKPTFGRPNIVIESPSDEGTDGVLRNKSQSMTVEADEEAKYDVTDFELPEGDDEADKRPQPDDFPDLISISPAPVPVPAAPPVGDMLLPAASALPLRRGDQATPLRQMSPAPPPAIDVPSLPEPAPATDAPAPRRHKSHRHIPAPDLTDTATAPAADPVSPALTLAPASVPAPPIVATPASSPSRDDRYVSSNVPAYNEAGASQASPPPAPEESQIPKPRKHRSSRPKPEPSPSSSPSADPPSPPIAPVSDSTPTLPPSDISPDLKVSNATEAAPAYVPSADIAAVPELDAPPPHKHHRHRPRRPVVDEDQIPADPSFSSPPAPDSAPVTSPKPVPSPTSEMDEKELHQRAANVLASILGPDAALPFGVLPQSIPTLVRPDDNPEELSASELLSVRREKKSPRSPSPQPPVSMRKQRAARADADGPRSPTKSYQPPPPAPPPIQTLAISTPAPPPAPTQSSFQSPVSPPQPTRVISPPVPVPAPAAAAAPMPSPTSAPVPVPSPISAPALVITQSIGASAPAPAHTMPAPIKPVPIILTSVSKVDPDLETEHLPSSVGRRTPPEDSRGKLPMPFLNMKKVENDDPSEAQVEEDGAVHTPQEPEAEQERGESQGSYNTAQGGGGGGMRNYAIGGRLKVSFTPSVAGMSTHRSSTSVMGYRRFMAPTASYQRAVQTQQLITAITDAERPSNGPVFRAAVKINKDRLAVKVQGVGNALSSPYVEPSKFRFRDEDRRAKPFKISVTVDPLEAKMQAARESDDLNQPWFPPGSFFKLRDGYALDAKVVKAFNTAEQVPAFGQTSEQRSPYVLERRVRGAHLSKRF